MIAGMSDPDHHNAAAERGEASAEAESPTNRRILSRERLHQGRVFDLERVTLADDAETELEREVVRHPGAVCVLPMVLPGEDGAASADEPTIVLIRNDRFAVERVLLELPAGGLEIGEAPERCAKRELEEETGYAASELAALGIFYTTPGITDEKMHAFVARGLWHVGQRLEAGEDIELAPMPVSRVLGLLDAGAFSDAKTMLTLLLAVRRGVIEGGA
jgi:ADP-ribose pyrophosphatase